jgi:hypothetical protein
MPNMTQTPESRAEPTTVTEQPRHDDRSERPSRLAQALAWVGIIAGVVFVVAVIFFSGLVLGWSSGGHSGWHHGYFGGRDDTCPMMGHGGMMGPGGMSPGGMGPGGPMGPQHTPTTTAPTPQP